VNLIIGQKRKPNGLVPFILFLITGFALPAYGAEWKLNPSLSVRGEFDDNLNLQKPDKISVWGIRVIPAVKFQYATEIVKIFVDPKVEFINFFDETNNNKESFTNFLVPLSVNYAGEKDELGFFATFLRDFTTQSELEETGTVVRFQQRTRRDGEVVWDHTVSERFTFNSAARFVDVTYEDASEDFGLFDYRGYLGSLGGTFRVAEKTEINSDGRYRYFRSPDAQYKAHNIGIGVGVDHEFSETLVGSFSTSGEYIFSKNENESDKNFVILMDGLVNKSWERTDLTVQARRNLAPSGRGVIRETNGASLTLRHQVTDKLSATVNATGIFSRSIGSGSAETDIADQFFWRTASFISWQWSERWRTVLSYMHRQRKIKGGNTAAGNRVNLQLTYNLPEFSISNWPELFISKK
jgi:hypothetical protein